MSDENKADVTPEEGTVIVGAGKTEEVKPAEESLEAAPKSEEKPEEAAPKDEKKPESEEDRKFSQKFAALSRREKAIKEREKKLEARVAELEAKSKPAPEPAKEPLEMRIRRNPFETLKELGIDYGALTQIALNEGKLTPELQLQVAKEELERKYTTEMEQLRKRLDDKEKQESDLKVAQQTQDFKNEIQKHVLGNTTDYDLLALEGQEGLEVVFDVIVAHYESTGNVMDIKEAATFVEEQLLEEAKIRLEKSNKIKGLIAPKSAPPEQKNDKRPSVTLSNEQAQVASTKKTAPITREEAIVEAAKLLRFNN